MNKKEYTQPSTKVVNIDSADIICTSTSTMSLDFGDPEEDDVPLVDSKGFIWGQ